MTTDRKRVFLGLGNAIVLARCDHVYCIYESLGRSGFYGPSNQLKLNYNIRQGFPNSCLNVKICVRFFQRSLGCTLVEMLTGKPPLSHIHPIVAAVTVAKGPIVPTLPLNVSQDAKEFIMAALTWLVLLISELSKWLSR